MGEARHLSVTVFDVQVDHVKC